MPLLCETIVSSFQATPPNGKAVTCTYFRALSVKKKHTRFLLKKTRPALLKSVWQYITGLVCHNERVISIYRAQE